MENFIVSARKYRPDSFDSVVGQFSITKTLKNSVKSGQLAHAYLFCGPRGVGKTTCARIFARTINCSKLTDEVEACNQCDSCKAINQSASFNIHELDAASNNSVEDIRLLIDQVRIPPQIGKYSVYIIDEVHMLSQAAFNAFLKTLEEPPKHAIFILATTEKHKIIPTILSRCQIFDFNRIENKDIVSHLKYVAENESVSTDDESLNLIAQKSDGALRDALSIFDQMVSFSGKQFGYKEVAQNLNVLDYDYYFRFVEHFKSFDISSTLNLIDNVYDKGFDGQILINGLTKHIRDLLVCKDVETAQLLETSDSIRKQYIEQTKDCDIQLLLQWIDILNAADVNYKQSNNKRLHTEVCMIKLCSASGLDKPKVSDKLPDKKQEKSKPVEKESVEKSTIEKEPEEHIPEEKVIEKVSEPEKKSEKKYVSQTPSIKDIKSGNIEKKDIEESETINESVESRKDEFTEDDVTALWIDIAEEYKNNPAFYALMKPDVIELKENHTVECFFASQTSKQTFEKEIYNEVLLKLKTGLNNDLVRLKITVLENQKNESNKLYTDSDKYQYLKSKNPDIDKLQQTFKLDFK